MAENQVHVICEMKKKKRKKKTRIETKKKWGRGEDKKRKEEFAKRNNEIKIKHYETKQYGKQRNEKK